MKKSLLQDVTYSMLLGPIRPLITQLIEVDISDSIVNGKYLEEILYPLVPPTYRSQKEKLVETIVTFMTGPIIVDRFATEADRRDYLLQLKNSELPEEKTVYEAYMCNALDYNLLIRAVWSMEKCIPEAFAISAVIFRTATEKYGELSTEERIKTVISVRSIMRFALSERS